MSERSVYIDSLKGFAILLMVLAHAIQRTYADYIDNDLFRIINSFHMPLFMFLSGFVVWNSTLNVQWLSKKVRMLIISFIAWYVVRHYMSEFYFTGLRPFINYPDSILQSIKQVIYTPANGPWYLFVLAQCYALLVLCNSLKPRYISYLTAIVSLYLLPFDSFGIWQLRWYFPFFIIGYLFAHHREKLYPWVEISAVCSSLAFPILVVWWKYDFFPGYPSPMKQLFSFPIPLFYSYAVSFTGLVAICFLFKIKPISYFHKLLAWFGKLSLEIYTGHALFLRLGFGSGMLKVTTVFMASLVMSIGVSYLIKQSSALNNIFYGGKNVDKKMSMKRINVDIDQTLN